MKLRLVVTLLFVVVLLGCSGPFALFGENRAAVPTQVPTSTSVELADRESPTTVYRPPTQVPPTSTPVLTAVPIATPMNSPTSAPTGALSIVTPTVIMTSTTMLVFNPCRDGEVIGNMYANPSRIPVGTAENNVVLELSWPGKGFGGYDRAVVVVPQLPSDVQIFVNNASTIHMVRYCGELAQVEAYVSDKATHIEAMTVTAANGQGQVPRETEIGVWSLDLTGTLRSLVLAPDGPATVTVQSHVEVVHLKSVVTTTTPTITSNRTPSTATPTRTARCTPVVMTNMGSWEAKDRVVQGPAVVNVGRPNEGNGQVRTLVPTGKTVVFLLSAGSGWDYTACGEAQAQAELTEFAGGLKIVKVDDLIFQGKAKWQ